MELGRSSETEREEEEEREVRRPQSMNRDTQSENNCGQIFSGESLNAPSRHRASYWLFVFLLGQDALVAAPVRRITLREEP